MIKDETIFFGLFSDGATKSSDRTCYFKESKTLKEFWDWIEDKRKELEDNNPGSIFIIKNMKFIYSKGERK